MVWTAGRAVRAGDASRGDGTEAAPTWRQLAGRSGLRSRMAFPWLFRWRHECRARAGV